MILDTLTTLWFNQIMLNKKNNTGKDNSGNGNSGNKNSGNRNSGDGNSGFGNSGNRNSGYWNSGDLNSGYGNSTNGEFGIFCSKEGRVRVFNKLTDLTWEEIDHPRFDEFHLNKWIREENMTDKEKVNYPKFHVRGGYLKTFTWKEAWANFWKDTDKENRQKILDLPNFDPEVFEDITGINVKEKKVVLSMDEVAEKFGVDIKHLKIEK